MPISVICQSCGKRFEVEERFAGREGNCDSCGAIIVVPGRSGTAAPARRGAKAGRPPATRGAAPGTRGRPGTAASASSSRQPPLGQPAATGAAAAAPAAQARSGGGDDIVIHAPEEYGGRGSSPSGRPIGKPIERVETQFSPIWAAGVAGGFVVLLIVDYIFGRSLVTAESATWAGWLHLALLALPAVAISYGGYFVLRDEEIEPYSGFSLWLRVGICAAAYTGLWALRLAVPVEYVQEIYSLVILGLAFLAIGTLIPFACFDLSPENSFFHFAFFLGASILLRYVAALPPVGPLTL